MIPQCSPLANDAQWLKYADWAERHFIQDRGMKKREVAAFKSALALGYQMGRKHGEDW